MPLEAIVDGFIFRWQEIYSAAPRRQQVRGSRALLLRQQTARRPKRGAEEFQKHARKRNSARNVPYGVRARTCIPSENRENLKATPAEGTGSGCASAATPSGTRGRKAGHARREFYGRDMQEAGDSSDMPAEGR